MRFNVIGGPIAWRPAAVSWGDQRVDVFAVTAKGEMGHWWSGDAATYFSEVLPTPRGGLPKVTPAAVSSARERLDVFCVGLDAQVHWWEWKGTPPFHTAPLPSAGLKFPATSVAAVSSRPGRVEVFAIAHDGSMRHWWKMEGAGWVGPEALGGPACAAGPHAVSWGENRLDVFAVGRDGHLKHWWWHGGGWQNESFPARLPAVVPHAVSHTPSSPGRSPGHLTVFCVGADAELHRWRFNGSWDLDQRLGGSLPASEICAVPSVDGMRLLAWASDRNGELLAWSVPNDDARFTLGAPPVALDNESADVMLPAAVRSTFRGVPVVNLYAAGQVGGQWMLVHTRGTPTGWMPNVFDRAAASLLIGGGGIDVRLRPLTPVEQYVAKMVFGDSLPLHRIHICNQGGANNSGFVMPTVFNEGTSFLRTIGNGLLSLITGIPQPISDLISHHAFGSSTSYTIFMGARPFAHKDPLGPPESLDVRALARDDSHWNFLVHELVHVWQGEHYASGNREYWLNSLGNQFGACLHGRDAYAYDGTNVPDWQHNQSEIQAKIVQDWFQGAAPGAARPLDPATSFYNRFIVNGILTRSTYRPPI